jgi:hypothetical protein
MIHPTLEGRFRMKSSFTLSTRDISFIAVMTALCVTSNYAMIGMLNVKFMDLFVFVSGYSLGSLVGIFVGCFTWLVYGVFNPYGFSLPIFVATSLGEAVYGLAGGLSRKFGLKVPDIWVSVSIMEYLSCSLKIAMLGFILTFFYDLFTNIVFAITVRSPIPVVLISGIPLAILHEASNFFFFLIGGAILINVTRRVLMKGGE